LYEERAATEGRPYNYAREDQLLCFRVIM
jgi:hypothetical protein